MPNLSLRLKTIAQLVNKNACVCDVGTDHAYLAIYLKKSGIATRVIATDLNQKPLFHAEKNIAAAKVSDIELRLCDGLSGLKTGEADTVIIAGMGGEVISDILRKGSDFAKNQCLTFIMQPTTSPEVLREYLCLNGFIIDEEIPLEENGKVYSIMKCHYTGEIYSKNCGFYYIGKVTSQTPSGLSYIKKQEKRCFECMNALKNIPEKQETFKHFQQAYEYIKKI